MKKFKKFKKFQKFQHHSFIVSVVCVVFCERSKVGLLLTGYLPENPCGEAGGRLFPVSYSGIGCAPPPPLDVIRW